MKPVALLLSSAALFLLAAKAHGRELRIERELLGFRSVVFGSPDNPPLVEALWRRERVYFWALTAGLGLLAGVKLARSELPASFTALVILTWVPSASFAGLGLWSLMRRGVTAEGATGSMAWWGLVLAAFSASALVARSHFSQA